MPHNRNSYIRTHLQKPITFVGMMGSGKTTIGRALAHALGLVFCDVDKCIEEKAGCSTSDIFSQFGEEKFRDVEAGTITELLDSGIVQIIATGGGAVLNANSLRQIKDKALSIWLDADLDTLYARVSQNKNRPLLQTDNPKETLKNLMEARTELYEEADMRFEIEGDSIHTAVNELLDELHAYLKHHRT